MTPANDRDDGDQRARLIAVRYILSHAWGAVVYPDPLPGSLVVAIVDLIPWAEGTGRYACASALRAVYGAIHAHALIGTDPYAYRAEVERHLPALKAEEAT